MNFECISVNKLMVTTAKFSQNFPHTERCSTSSSPRQFLLHNSKEPLTNPYFLVQNFQTKIAPKTISKLSTHADSISGLESSKTIKNFPNLSQSRRSLQHKSTNSPSVDPKNRKSDPSAHAITTKTTQKNPEPQKDQKPRKKPIPPNLKEITLASLLKDINSSEDEVEGTKEDKQPMAKSRAGNKQRVRIPSLRTEVLEKPLRADSSNISPLPSTFRKDSPSAPKSTNMMFLNYGNENATLVLKDQVPKSSPRVAFAESTGQLADVHALQRKNKPALITKLNIEGGKKERSPSISPKVTIKKEPHTPGRYLTTNYQTKSIRPLAEANEESLSPVQPRMSAPKTASATYRQKNLGRKKSLEIEQAESSYQIKQKFLRSFSGKIFPMQEDEDNPASSYALLSDRGPETQEKYPTSIENIIADSRHSVSRRVRLLTTTVEKGSEEAQARLPGSETIKKYFPGAELVQRTSLKKKSLIKTNPENRSISQINRPTERKRTTAFTKVGSKIMDPEQPSNSKEKELFVFNPPSNPIFHKKFSYNAKIKRDIANIKKFVGQFQHKTDYKSLRIKLKEALNFLRKVKLNPKEVLVVLLLRGTYTVIFIVTPQQNFQRISVRKETLREIFAGLQSREDRRRNRLPCEEPLSRL